MTITNICSGFRVTGIQHPVNRDVFSHIEVPPLVKESGLAFIPLYSPASRHTIRIHDGVDFSRDEACGYNSSHDYPESSN